MPTLQAILDETAFNTLPESTVLGKDSYNQNSETGQWYLNLPDTEAEKLAFNLQKVLATEKAEKEKLVENNSELLKQKKTKDEQLKVFQGIGKSAEEIKAALEANRPEDVARLLTEKENEKIAAVKSFEDVLEKEKSAREAYQKQLFQSAVDTRIAKVRAKYDLNDTAELVLRQYYQVVEGKDNSIETKIFLNGIPAQVANQDMTDEQLLLGFKEKKQYLSMFNAGTNEGGGGTPRTSPLGGNGKTMKRSEFDSMAMSNPEGLAKLLDSGVSIVE